MEALAIGAYQEYGADGSALRLEPSDAKPLPFAKWKPGFTSRSGRVRRYRDGIRKRVRSFGKPWRSRVLAELAV
ncbi:MAG: hypothetical protein A2269_09045 [Lentisphaerae bacterium RIFOXYA12_FULL_60_10]|nr:MAG: hypothetical protein A2269_09045 [Lentisphaerae bacterium RIFOXYA12_FULL_60_10]